MRKFKELLLGIWPWGNGDKVDAALPVDYAALPVAYADIVQNARMTGDIHRIRDTINRIVELDQRSIDFTIVSLRRVSDAINSLLSDRDRDIQQILSAIAEVDTALASPKGKEARRLDEQTRLGLEQAHQMLLKDKTRAIMYLHILLEVYRIIHTAREERQQKIAEINGHIQAVEAAEDRARRAHALVNQVVQAARLGEERLDGLIGEISPELLELVKLAAELNTDIILEGADVMNRAKGTVMDPASLDTILGEVGAARALPELIEAKLDTVGGVSALRSLLNGNVKLSGDAIARRQLALSTAVSNALTGSWKATAALSFDEVGATAQAENTGVSRFSECKEHLRILGNTPQASERIAAIVSQDTLLSAEELEWIRKSCDGFDNIKKALLGHANLNEDTLRAVFVSYGEKPPFDAIVLTMQHPAATTNLREQLNTDEVLKAMVEGNARAYGYPALVECMFGGGLSKTFPLEVFRSLERLYPSTSDKLFEAEGYHQDSRPASEITYRTEDDEIAIKINHFLRIARCYYTYCAGNDLEVDATIIELICTWMEQLPQTITRDGEKVFGFKQKTRDWTERSLCRRDVVLEGDAFVEAALRDHTLPEAQVDHLLRVLPTRNYGRVHYLALKHPNNTKERLSDTYKKIRLHQYEADALADNVNLTEEGLAFIWKTCDTAHQLVVVAHKNVGRQTLVDLQREGRETSVKYAANGRLMQVSRVAT